MHFLSLVSFALLAASVDAVEREYHVSSKKMTYDEAKDYCYTNGGWLAFMDSENLEEAADKLYEKKIKQAYVGKHSRDSKKIHVVSIDSHGAASISPSGGTTKRYALCQRELDQSESVTGSVTETVEEKRKSTNHGRKVSRRDVKRSKSRGRKSGHHSRNKSRHGRKSTRRSSRRSGFEYKI
jgi:hypothetical protein